MDPLPRVLATGLDRLLQASAARAVGGAARDLARLLLPADCAVCGLYDGTVCDGCAPELTAELLRPFRAERDAPALPLVPPGHPAAQEDTPVPLPVVAAGRYGGALAAAILAFKDHGRTPVGGSLRPAVYRALAAAPGLLATGPGGTPVHPPLRATAPVLLVPVPGSGAGFRRRGYDPVAELLAGPLPRGWEPAPRLLRTASPVQRVVGAARSGGGALAGFAGAAASHAGSASHHRRRRSTGRFRPTVRPGRAQGRTVVLFDDVLTTGSTLAAAWRALDSRGLTPAAAVVLAAVTAPGAAADGGLNSG